MKRTLLFVLALVAVGCADAGQSASCESLSPESLLEDILSCAEQGDADAQYFLGFMYANGDGVPEDDTEAVRWYRLAAEQGRAAAQYEVGYMYANGDGVPEDDTEAAHWYRLAAEQGNGMAQIQLGLMYEDGKGVPEDSVLAYMWYNLAAAQATFGGAEGKDRLEQQMTREQIAEAQRLSREWIAAHPPGDI